VCSKGVSGYHWTPNMVILDTLLLNLWSPIPVLIRCGFRSPWTVLNHIMTSKVMATVTLYLLRHWPLSETLSMTPKVPNIPTIGNEPQKFQKKGSNSNKVVNFSVLSLWSIPKYHNHPSYPMKVIKYPTKSRSILQSPQIKSQNPQKSISLPLASTIQIKFPSPRPKKIFAVIAQRRHANVALESETGLIMQILCVTICLNWSLIENFNLESLLGLQIECAEEIRIYGFLLLLMSVFLFLSLVVAILCADFWLLKSSFFILIFFLIFNSLTQMWKSIKILKFLFWDVIKYKKEFFRMN